VITFPDAFDTNTDTFDEDKAFELAMTLALKYEPIKLRTYFHGPAVAILQQQEPANYSFCDDSCSIFAIRSLDTSGLYPVNLWYHELTNASCRNFVEEDLNWDKLITTVPGKLTESYVNCVLTPFSAIVNAGGVAMGLTSIAMTVIFVVLFSLMHAFESVGLKIQDDRQFNKFEFKLVLEKFAHILLDAINGRYEGVVVRPEIHQPIEAPSPQPPSTAPTPTSINSTKNVSFFFSAFSDKRHEKTHTVDVASCLKKSRIMQIAEDMKEHEQDKVRNEKLEARGITAQMRHELQLFQFGDSRTFHTQFDISENASEEEELIPDKLWYRSEFGLLYIIYCMFDTC
jgi:hypothetical protein